MEQLTATVLDIQRMSTEDGPGIRTTIFFKGCTLACSWCHNPESIHAYREAIWNPVRCIGCGDCVRHCKTGALQKYTGGIELQRNRCAHCMACAETCPSGSMEAKGTVWGLNELLREVLKDRAYFGPNGGITLSGGEALMQHRFVAGFLEALKREGVHTAIDTAGHVGWEAFSIVLPYTDLVLYDMKIFDNAQHAAYTGQGNERLLKNLLTLAGKIKSKEINTKLWIRTPVIPGATDGAENIAAIAKFIHEHLDGAVERWELCAFNNLCRDKYTRLGRDWQFDKEPLLEHAKMERLCNLASEYIRGSTEILATGATKLEE